MREGVRETDQPVGFDKDIEEVEHPIPLADPLLELGEAGWFRLCGQALDGEEAALVIGSGFRQMHMGVWGRSRLNCTRACVSRSRSGSRNDVTVTGCPSR